MATVGIKVLSLFQLCATKCRIPANGFGQVSKYKKPSCR